MYTFGDIELASPSAAATLEAYIYALISNISGAIIHCSTFSILVYPPRQECWKFLTPQTAPGPRAKLQFRIIAPLPPPVPRDERLLRSLSKREESDIERAFRILFGVSYDRLSVWPGRTPSRVDKNAFLIIHPRYHEEIDILTRFFHALGVKVYHSNVPGSWEFFTNHITSGNVIVGHVPWVSALKATDADQ